MEKTLYKDKKVTITNRKIIFAEKSVNLALIQTIDVRQLQDSSRTYRTFIYLLAWGLLLLMLNFTPIPTGFLFIVGVAGIWWLILTAWPYVVVAGTKQGEEIVFSSFNKGYTEKIAHILGDMLGFE